MQHPIIIVGAGLAGYQLAREFRKVNSTMPLLLITADEGRYYYKPKLSVALTQGKNLETLTTATATAMASELQATIHTHTPVLAINPLRKVLVLAEKELPYEKLVLACGAEVINPLLAGDAVENLFSINHIYHYTAFQEKIKNKKHITVLGMGLIGCEFANDLSNAGYEVHLIAPVKAPLDLLVPDEIGKLLQTALEKNGVVFHLACTVTHMNKAQIGYCLTLSNGEKIFTDFVLSAIGLKPHVDLALTAKLQTNRGILVNRYLESSIADIYALGDCAEVEGHVLPFITPLLNSARALAKTLSGERTMVQYPAMPILVKTPTHPLAICPAPKNLRGQWIIESESDNVRALFFDEQQQLHGFVLTNAAVKERDELAKKIPPFFDAAWMERSDIRISF